MSFYAYIFLGAVVAVSIFEYILEILNYRYLTLHGNEVPAGFEDEVDISLLEKTTAYSREKIRFGLCCSIFDEIVLILFIYLGYLNSYSCWINSFEFNFIVSGLMFYLLLSWGKTFIDIPFSLYGTFGIEKKYGFNTMTMRLWGVDFIKSLLISALLMGVVIAGALWIVVAFPDLWWLVCWCFFFVFTIFFMYVSPYIIEPLFNKFSPLENDELEEKIKDVLSGSGIEISRVFKMDASRRTRHSNAYFTGFGRVKRIVLYDTLLESMSDEEIVAVLAHEAGHWKKKHILKNLVLFEAISLSSAYIAFWIIRTGIIPEIFNLSGESRETFFAQTVLLSFMASALLWPIAPMMAMISRKFEREADDFACCLMADGGANLASALIKLSRENLANLHPHPFYAFFHYSHPPIVERVGRLKSARGHKSGNQ